MTFRGNIEFNDIISVKHFDAYFLSICVFKCLLYISMKNKLIGIWIEIATHTYIVFKIELNENSFEQILNSIAYSMLSLSIFECSYIPFQHLFLL